MEFNDGGRGAGEGVEWCDEGGETEVGTHSFSSRLRSWVVVFIRGRSFSYVAVDVICGRLFSYVGVRLYAWAVIFICGRSFSYVGNGCGCGSWIWTRCGWLCRCAGRVHCFVGGLRRL